MSRLKIIIRKPDQNRESTVVIGRFGSMLINALLVLVTIAMVSTAFIFGYILIGLVFVALLFVILVALIRGLIQNYRR